MSYLTDRSLDRSEIGSIHSGMEHLSQVGYFGEESEMGKNLVTVFEKFRFNLVQNQSLTT